MANQPDDQDEYGGLAQDLLGKVPNAATLPIGLANSLLQGIMTSAVDIEPMPPAGHLLGHVPTAAPAALGDMAAPTGTSGSDIGSSTQELGEEALDEQRPDLGWPNTIRSLLPQGFSKDMFDNYILGRGNYQLSPDRFQDIVNTIKKLKQSSSMPVPVTGPNGQPLKRVACNFSSSPDYARSLGSASLFYDQAGNPVGFYDDYNFDPAINKRKLWPEIETQVMHAVHPLLPPTARPFEIRYGLYARPQ